ncbi:MAG: pimeloyl-ACP methyl ester carboxylesterase [Cellvibrionaceae bacterium]|jgi:pimeloyl-ACP methyl ester carboxylesterase
MAKFLLVHGVTAGGWIWKQVASLLREAGHDVYTPTLTGVGERVHLLTRDVDLGTHIEDIVNVIIYEELREVILVGHSYGGAVVSGVAERIPERLSHLVFLDAQILRDGESVNDLYDRHIIDAMTERVRAHGDGWRFTPREPKLDPRCTDHPLRTLNQPLDINNPVAAALPRTCIFCTEKEEMGPIGQGIIRSAARARAAGWPYYELRTGHDPQLTMPNELVNLFAKLV